MKWIKANARIRKGGCVSRKTCIAQVKSSARQGGRPLVKKGA
jgi:hypothetical protein